MTVKADEEGKGRKGERRMIGRTNALRAAQGGVTEGEKPAAAYSGKWTGWRLAF